MLPPSGGEKDIDPPFLINTEKNKDNTFVFTFNEYIQLNKWVDNFYLSPPVKNTIKKKIRGNKLILSIEDSLNPKLTYNINLNNCIKDFTEGNIIKKLNYLFSETEQIDTLALSGCLKESYTLDSLSGYWVLLYPKDIADSLIFKTTPMYITKTDENGLFDFPNIKNMKYQIYSLSGFDFLYNTGESIGFYNQIIDASIDSFISLNSFSIKTDTAKIDTAKIDTGININDSIVEESLIKGNLYLKINSNTSCVFQLIDKKEVAYSFSFSEPPYILKDIRPGEYTLKYINDENNNGEWDTGNFENRIQPEKTINYHNNITIRSNWDLELDWNINEL